MPRFEAGGLAAFVGQILVAVGAPPEKGRLVADALVDANLSGHDSHGVIRVAEYVAAVRNGAILPRSEPRVTAETATTLAIDGGHGFGQVVAMWTMDRLLEKGKRQGMAAGGISNCGHIGRLGAYVQSAAKHGFVALAFVNGGGSEPRVAPFGGRKAVLGTNPLAAAVPAGNGTPIVIDFSTAAVASGKIRTIRDEGGQLPDGWIIDRLGRPSRDPKDYYAGGALLPAAGHKGYGLAILAEAMGGLLSGAGSPTLSGWGAATTNGVLFWVLDVRTFQPLEKFCTDVAALGNVIKATPAMDPNGAVLLPGEPELLARTARTALGIQLPKATWEGLAQVAADLGVSGAPVAL